MFERGTYVGGKVVSPVTEEGDPSFSQLVPKATCSFNFKREMEFLKNAINFHREEMEIKYMEQILSGERERLIHSPPFIVDRRGYKLCLHIALYHNNFSIAIKIMKGERDKQLVWPFNMIVIIRLHNQSGDEDKIKMFRCEKNGPRLRDSLSRPKTDMNSPIGFPNFISRHCLLKNGFVRNNMMLLTCYLFPKDTNPKLDSDYPSIIRSKLSAI